MASILPEPPDNNGTAAKITRKPVPRRVRFEVLRRDNYTCRYCRSTDDPLTIDHVKPVVLGGTDEPSNLVACCKDCNTGKASSTPDESLVDQVSEDAVRWAKAMEAAANRYVASRMQTLTLYDYVYDEWQSASATYRRGRAELPADYEASVDQWLRAGAPPQLIDEAIAVAMRNSLVDNWNVWRYACGVVWTRLGQMQDEAKASLAEPKARTNPLIESYWNGFSAALDEPEVSAAFLTFKWLSKVVDGPQPWNRTRVDMS